MSNRLHNRFQSHMTTPVGYMNNNLLNNNPAYSSMMLNPDYHRQMMIMKEQRRKQIRNVGDLNMTREQIVEYVICPIKVEKSDKTEIERLNDDLNSQQTKEFLERNYWNNRTNLPYKNVIKEEDYWKRDFRKQKDLIVHKVTDMDKLGLMDEYYELLDILERHDSDLKVIYSASKKTEHKRKFKYVQKLKYRMKYDPKDYKDLTDYYKKQQHKHNKRIQQYDNIIEMITENENMTDKELKAIEAEFLYDNDTKKKRDNRRAKTKKDQKHKLKEKDRKLEQEIAELVEEHGEDVLDILDELDDEDNASDDSSKSSRSSKSGKAGKTRRSVKIGKAGNTGKPRVTIKTRSAQEPNDSTGVKALETERAKPTVKIGRTERSDSSRSDTTSDARSTASGSSGSKPRATIRRPINTVSARNVNDDGESIASSMSSASITSSTTSRARVSIKLPDKYKK